MPGGSANSYDYVSQDPVNLFDLDGRQERYDVSGGSCGDAGGLVNADGELTAEARAEGWQETPKPRRGGNGPRMASRKFGNERAARRAARRDLKKWKARGMKVSYRPKRNCNHFHIDFDDARYVWQIKTMHYRW